MACVFALHHFSLYCITWGASLVGSHVSASVRTVQFRCRPLVFFQSLSHTTLRGSHAFFSVLPRVSLHVGPLQLYVVELRMEFRIPKDKVASIPDVNFKGWG